MCILFDRSVVMTPIPFWRLSVWIAMNQKSKFEINNKRRHSSYGVMGCSFFSISISTRAWSMLEMVGSPWGHSSNSLSFCIIISASAETTDSRKRVSLSNYHLSNDITANSLNLTAVRQVSHVCKCKCERHYWYQIVRSLCHFVSVNSVLRRNVMEWIGCTLHKSQTCRSSRPWRRHKTRPAKKTAPATSIC